jgi:hypothetical protein
MFGVKVTRNFAAPASNWLTCDGIIIPSLSLIAISKFPKPARPASTVNSTVSFNTLWLTISPTTICEAS